MQHNPRYKKTPVLYVFFGMIAAGKSTLAQAWARHKHIPYYNSDRVRKELANIAATESRRETIDTGIYTTEFTQKTYNTLLQKASDLLKKGYSVILDASYQYGRDRQDAKTLALNMHSGIYFIFCRCSEEEMRRRMALRARDPANVSDGRWEIYQQQKKRFELPEELAASELVVIDTEAPLEDLLQKLDNKLHKLSKLS